MKKFSVTYPSVLFIAAFLFSSCVNAYMQDNGQKYELAISAGTIQTKSADPDENLISDINIFIFNDRGCLEYSKYFLAEELKEKYGEYYINAGLLDNAVYSVYVLANSGYSRTGEVREKKDIENLSVYLAYPDEYKSGIPMYGSAANIKFKKGVTQKITLERLMSKISVSIDRSRLDKDVEFIVREIEIGGCPKTSYAFKKNTIDNTDKIFTSGFSKSGKDLAPLNERFCEEVSVYMLENLQGNLLEGITDESQKILDESDPKSRLCSFIELKIEYTSPTHSSLPGKDLVYRFYLGESPENFDIHRNTHYHFTLIPEKDGLGENSWRVDKSGISATISPYMKIYPGNFIRGKTGETHHVRCEYYPSDTEFDIGLKELEYDKERGIYDYVLDEDGNGVTLTLKGRGSGILYFRTGYPINQEEMVAIIVD